MSSHNVYDELSRVRRPQQDRSRQAQFAALDAFEGLLRERPLNRVTVQEVADRARLSITSVYARFDGKKALVLALHERVIHDGVGQLSTILEESTATDAAIEDTVATLMERAVRFAKENTHVFSAVLSAGDEETNERAAGFIRAASGAIAQYFIPRLEAPADQVDRDVDFAWRTVMAVLQQTWALGGEEPARYPLDEVALATRLTRLFLDAIGRTA